MDDARKLVEIIYPAGSYAKSFSAGTREFYDKQAGSEEMRKLDPNSAERMRIIYKTIDAVAEDLGKKHEAAMREAMVRSALATYSETELRDIRAFLETTSGRAYTAKGSDLLKVMDTPEQAAIQMLALEELTEKIEAATAHLPMR